MSAMRCGLSIIWLSNYFLNGMKKKHYEHIGGITERFKRDAYRKYAKGQKEHGGNLYDMPLEQLLTEIRNELLDLVIYFDTLTENLKKK